MFIQRRMLMLASAMCAIAITNSASAASEFEAKWRNVFVEAYLEYLKNQGYNALSGDAEIVADCHIRYVLQGFTHDEVALLDAWAAGGTSPGDLAKTAAERMTAATEHCPYRPNASVLRAFPHEA